MKEAKFIELLNLYIDQQIDAADAAMLEEEIQRLPERRKIYQQYCRMSRACSMLLEQSRPPEAAVGQKLAQALAAAEEQVVEFPAPRPFLGRFVYVGGLAAACIAVAFVLFPRTKTPDLASGSIVRSDQVVQINSASPAAPLANPNGLIAASSAAINYQTVLVARSPRANGASAESNLVAPANDHPSLDWMNQVKFSPVSVSPSDLVFETGTNLKVDGRDDQRIFHSRLPVAVPDQKNLQESNALEFRR
jgi:hypothetical protein